MIRSMTAFAAAERNTPWGMLACEIRAVNHRFLELGVRLPEELRLIEPALRERIGAQLARGKVDVTLRLRADGSGPRSLQLDPAVLDRLGVIAAELRSRLPTLQVEMSQLLQLPGVLQQPELDQAVLQQTAMALLDEALAHFVGAREREGDKLAQGMRERIDAIAERLVQVRALLPGIREALHQRLRLRLAEVISSADPGRLEQELVLGLQKLDVDEELDRLDSHLAEARRVLKLREAVGRRLDFLMQEFNREANTLGSKSVDARTSQIAVDLKVLIEQLREQVQNIE
ncbi:MAG: YicC/YloC family endoribonuclease [Xanthomonadaceae bacterium]|nr:YicC/YloC family endoribonuclease [Xanthomonadaceae bacterium]